MNWADELIARLGKLWPVEKPLNVEFAPDDHVVWSLHDGVALGACNIRTDGITIYLRAEAENTEQWRDVLIHEYTHAAMAGLLDAVENEVPLGIEAYRTDRYVQAMETVTMRVAALLEYAVRTGAVERR